MTRIQARDATQQAVNPTNPTTAKRIRRFQQSRTAGILARIGRTIGVIIGSSLVFGGAWGFGTILGFWVPVPPPTSITSIPCPVDLERSTMNPTCYSADDALKRWKDVTPSGYLTGRIKPHQSRENPDNRARAWNNMAVMSGNVALNGTDGHTRSVKFETCVFVTSSFPRPASPRFLCYTPSQVGLTDVRDVRFIPNPDVFISTDDRGDVELKEHDFGVYEGRVFIQLYLVRPDHEFAAVPFKNPIVLFLWVIPAVLICVPIWRRHLKQNYFTKQRAGDR